MEVNTIQIVNNITQSLGQYVQCYIARDAASRWTNPAKTYRLVEQGVEAIQLTALKAQGVEVNPFTGMQTQLQQPDVVKDDSTKRLSKEVHFLKKDLNATNKKLDMLLDRIPAAE